jgi:dienelactone hydrolase
MVTVDELRERFAQNGFDFAYPIMVEGRSENIQHRVYWNTKSLPGEKSPAVLVMHELPGLTENCLRFAERLVDQGFTVYLPLLFGELGESSQPLQLGANTVRFTVQLCMSREFSLLKAGASSPIVDWLRGLCQHLYQKEEHHCFPGIGAIGMCLTGGFVLSLMIDESVIAPVASQPSLPLGLTPGQRKALDISPCDLERAKQRAEETGLLVVRFQEDVISPAARLQTLENTFDKTLEKFVITGEQRQQEGIRAFPHAVFTEHFANADGHPYGCTQAAFNKVLHFLQERLISQS